MKKILLVGWGTGWHILPLLAIYNGLSERKDLEFFWIWERDSLEEKIAKDNNIKFFPIKSGKLRRYFSFKTFLEPFNILTWIFESLKILNIQKPDLIFSKWWYVSLPMAIAWKMAWINIFMHESDSIPWLSNRIVGKFALKVFLGFENAKKYFNPKKCEVVWQILNPDLFIDIWEKEISNKTNLLVIAWSQWSTRIFNFLLENIQSLDNFDITIVLWSQNIYLKEKFDNIKNIRTYWFVDHQILKKLYNNADIAITRAWATNLAELEAFFIKMMIIPLKESANNHQYFNALEYEKRWNIMITEDELYKKWLKEILYLEWYKKQELNNSSLSSSQNNIWQVLGIF